MRKLYSNIFLFLIVFLHGTTSFSQDFSNKGKEFWIPYSFHVDMFGTNPSLTMTLYITSDVTTTYQVEIFGVTTLQSGTINAGQVVTCVVPQAYFINNEGLFTGKTVRVTSVLPVVVYSYITQSARSGATVCLPTTVLGREYYSSNYRQISNSPNSDSYFTIIAVEDNTTVNITPADTTKNGWLPGNTYPVTLNKGQIYQVLGKHYNTAVSGLYYGKDLTGSKIESVASGTGGCKRIAVFSGAGKIMIGNCTGNNTSSDNLYQQLYPVASWGKNYLTVPSYNRITNFYRIIKKPTVPTNVFLNGALIPAASFVNGVYYEFSGSVPNKIDADQPVSVSQYFTTQGCNGNVSPYDPDMIMLNPVEQNIKKVTLVSSNLAAGNPQHHIHVIMRNGGTGISTFKMDNIPVPASSWVTHPQDAAYSYLYLGNVTQGYHTLESDSGFNALAYGYANAESYGYSAGSNIKDLYQYVSIQNTYATINFPATCRNTPFYFTMTFPYQPTSILWQFNGLFPDFNMPDPTVYFIGTIVVNGKTLYQYRIPNPYTIPNIGTYPIKVVAVNPTPDGCGSTQEINYDIQVFDNPLADFTTNNVCFPNPVQFTDISTTGGRPIISRFWDFGDNTTGNTSNPSHAYPAPSPPPYNARYAIITDVGCLSDTTTHPVTVHPLPTATVTGTVDVCQNGTEPLITFTGAAGTPPYTFTYNINGGAMQTLSSAPNTTVATVSAPTNIAGTFVYNLVSVQDASPAVCSQPQTGSITVTVNPLPTATLAGTISVCQNATPPDVIFTGASGTPPYTFTYNINGGANQTVTTTGGNTGTVQAPTGTTGTFVYNLINVQDASSTACIQNQSGTYTVNVNALPTASISGTTEVCRDAAQPLISFTGSGTTSPYTFTYNINGGPNQTVTSIGNVATVSVPTTTAGTFTYNLISVIDASSTLCSQVQTGTATVIVHPLPSPAFSAQATPKCEQGIISFSDLSVPNVGILTNWQWNFDDPASGANNVSTLQNPVHVFNLAGTYNVTLSVTNDQGCVSNPVFTLPVLINPKPLAGYIIPDVCLSDTYAQFNDTSQVMAPDAVNVWQWNFGDPGSGVNNTSVLQNPQHSYTAIGTYNVELIVTSNNGCKDTVSHVLSVNGSFPVANFTLLQPANLCANDSVAIVEASTVFPGVITKIQIYWDNINQPALFDEDDFPVTGRTYKHLYPNFQTPATRTYQIRYRAYSGGVCVNDKLQDITVHAAPRVQFLPLNDVCFDASPFQITQASEIGGVPGSFVFSGPGVSSTGIFNPAAVAPGNTYALQYLWSSTAAGCKDSATQTILVIDTATARFSWQSLVCEKSLTAFNSTASTIPAGAGNIVGWQWNFGNPGSGAANISALQNPAHNYMQWGTFNVSLQVISDRGCRSTIRTLPVYVNPIARPNFTVPASVCLPTANVTFNSSSSWIPDGSQAGFSYLWNFGDPPSGPLNTATVSNPSHLYSVAQPYAVNLQITSNAGCTHDTTIVINNIHPEPIGDILVDRTEVCVGSAFQFRDNSNPMDGVTTQWFWTMDDGNTRSVRTFPYTYSSPGTYNVKLYTINSHGCRSTTDNQTVTVHPYPVLDAGPDRFVLEGGQITLTATASGNDLTYMWTPNLYFISSNTVLNPTVQGVDDIRYVLRVTARGNCSDTSSVFIKVLKYPLIPNIFSPNGDGVHDRWIIGYLESYPGATVDIYNRYGQLIFHSEGYAVPWDGKVNGKDVPVGTYYYIVNPKNGRSIQSGYVDVVR